MKQEPRQANLMVKPLGTAWVDPKVGWGGASGNHQGGATSVSQIARVLDVAPTLPALWGKGSPKEQWPPPVHLSRRKLPLQPSPQCRTTQFFLLCLWCLSSCLPHAGAQREQVRGSLCVNPLKGTAWGSNSLSSRWFYNQK
uniref:Uncharacterized protein n=1 Tax=Molossus molossus TaxID=27622 RepID=A0A7J8FRV5_MOLMO|nr:hypothetical protein HJG59_008322 [Molossus molossus]